MFVRPPTFSATAFLLLSALILYLPAGCDPIISGQPFVILWNAPTQPCLDKHNISLDLEAFDIIVNQNHSFRGPEMVIFYNNQLGLYPFYNQDNEPVNGGLPQNSSLEDHLVKAQQDLEVAIVDQDFRGAAVVDWEDWRPLWDRNWENMTLYHFMSLKLVKQRHPNWSYGKLKRVAKRKFEAAAKEFILSTLMMALELRPRGLWGFYGFPDCYNFGFKNTSQEYTGQCSDDEMRRNDQMGWLWQTSRALYPQIYLDQDLKNSQHVGPYVRHRVIEGLRISADAEIPVLPYARIVYVYSLDFLSQDDLIKTIGQTAALGASGIVLWGNNDYSRTKESCLAVQQYTEETLAPYLKNVTMAAILCSHELCSGFKDFRLSKCFCPQGLMSHKVLLLAILHLVTVSVSLSASPGFLLPGRPFVTVWNAPTGRCWEKYGVDLDLDPFDIVVNQNQSFAGSEMVIFYHSQLGLYPYYDDDDNPVNDGLPQSANLSDHLNVAYKDLMTTIPFQDFTGAAVIDWEDWRPLWDRNWDKKDIYREHSKELVRRQHPEWSESEILLEAKREFEEAAEKFITSTLALSRKLKPGGLWGLYGFPGCYNYDYKKGGHNYTGECPSVEVARNDLLKWMWRSSQALYPDIYLEQMLKHSRYVKPYVKHRLKEAFRVSEHSVEGDLPVFPYTRIVYTYSMDFLTQEDLIQTIGQSAAQGTAGVVLWGNNDYSNSKEDCLAVKSYLDSTLGRYVVNVTSGATLCSHALCAGNGRCVRKDSASNHHLHLHPDSFSIRRNPEGKGFLVSGEASKMDVLYMAVHFQCRCYPGWERPDCSHRAS